MDLKWLSAEERELYLRYVAAFYGLDNFLTIEGRGGVYILDPRDLKVARDLINRGHYVEVDADTTVRAFRAAVKTAPSSSTPVSPGSARTA
ncbi:MAG: hypothetical protein QW324_08490 [Thermofilaceae archaeon]